MTVFNFVLLCVCACAGVCVSGLSQLEGSACISSRANGKCMASSKCASEATSQAYLAAGYGVVESLPERCSEGDSSDLVCCTDCADAQPQTSGQLVEKKGPKALDKCLEYFQRLPYRCRTNVQVSRTLDEQKKCHRFNVTVAAPSVKRFPLRSKDKYTYLALLGYGKDAATAEWACSGGVISERFILTAAFCTYYSSPVSFVRLGNQRRSESPSSWHLYNIKRAINHPEYADHHKYNDIALLETEKEITFSSDVLPMCLNMGDKDLSKVIFTGWNSFERELSQGLMAKELIEQPESACVSANPITEYLNNGYNHTSMMCYNVNATGLCQGGRGGPVQTVSMQCAYTAVGVTTLNWGCGPGTQDIYTRVSHFVPWIESIVWP